MAGNAPDDSFETTVNLMVQLVNRHIVPTIEWYQDHSMGPQYLFRTAGFVVVTGSVVLPVLSTMNEWKFKTLAVSVVSLTIAICSSIATFYRWDASWRSRIKAQMELKGVLAQWELDLAAARIKDDPRKEVVEATQRLFAAAMRLAGAETEGFFADLKMPEVSAPRS
jgi:Protein of unknown function (DUF4231)